MLLLLFYLSVMRKRLIKGMIPSLSEFMSEVIYHPYYEDFRVTVKEDERIIIEGPGWTVILDHSKGDFSFTGSCIKYYDIEVIRDIWLSYGDIYTVMNYHKYKGDLETEFVLSKKEEERLKSDNIEYQRRYREKNKEKIREQKREYYRKNKEKLMEYQREYQRRKKEES